MRRWAWLDRSHVARYPGARAMTEGKVGRVEQRDTVGEVSDAVRRRDRHALFDRPQVELGGRVPGGAFAHLGCDDLADEDDLRRLGDGHRQVGDRTARSHDVDIDGRRLGECRSQEVGGDGPDRPIADNLACGGDRNGNEIAAVHADQRRPGAVKIDAELARLASVGDQPGRCSKAVSGSLTMVGSGNSSIGAHSVNGWLNGWVHHRNAHPRFDAARHTAG